MEAMKTIKTSGKAIAIIIIAIIVIVFAGFYLFVTRETKAGDYKKATYTIDGSPVSFKTGEPAGIKYQGDELIADFDGNGRKDIAFLVSKETSTTTSYYLLAALNKVTGYEGLKGRFIGNEITPMTIVFADGNITVNYEDRRPGEPMTALPRFWYAKTFAVRNGELVRAIKI